MLIVCWVGVDDSGLVLDRCCCFVVLPQETDNRQQTKRQRSKSGVKNGQKGGKVLKAEKNKLQLSPLLLPGLVLSPFNVASVIRTDLVLCLVQNLLLLS